jgi:prolyl-tRNA editing enzyme YbaK/EbsC (Cys-tRNA(Pro) deacylase)
MSLLEHEAVARVRAALRSAGSPAEVIALDETARSARDAAAAIGTELGSIVKSLVFVIGGRAVMALVAGDRRCDETALPAALGIAGQTGRADADLVRAATGFAIGGVAPAGLPAPLPTVVDSSLKRFDTVYAAAGHPHCVFATTVNELLALTGGEISTTISVPL